MTTNILAEAREYGRVYHDTLLAEVRRTTGVEEPQYSRFPLWLKPRVNARGLRSHRAGGRDYGCHSGWHACEAIEHHVDALGGPLFDHHGRIRGADGAWLLVSEPYRSTDDTLLIAAVQRVAELLLLDYAIEARSWWNPPSTIRITWWPKQGQDEQQIRRELKAKRRTKRE